MTGTKAMKLWTTLITAFLALFATLGFTTTASAATPVQQATETCKSTPTMTAPLAAYWAAAYERSLPPTMKQRIRAEAHGSSPSCRHVPTDDTETAIEAEAHPGRLAAEP